LPRPNAKTHSKTAGEEELPSPASGLFLGDRIPFDLSTHLTYMSSLATSGLSRDPLFEKIGSQPYVTAPYFRNIRLLTTRLGYNYPRACEVVAEKTKDESIRSFLLRFAGSLASGERETDFLAREAEVQFESHKNRYERDLESLRKWTDGFVALEVSVALVVIIAIVSLMLFPLGNLFVAGLGFVGILVATLGAYVIYRSAPSEVIQHNLKVKSPEQHKTAQYAKGLVPVAIVAGAGSYAALGMAGVSMLLSGMILFPVGWMALRYAAKIEARDRDTPAFLRAVGGVTAAIGSTVTEAIGRIDLRSMGNLEPEVTRLYKRLKGGIRPDLCWQRFIGETGSELAQRSVSIFWDAIRAGGDAGRVGYLSSLFALHITLLRAKRAMVSNTFGWLMIPMHGTLIGLLSFITEIFALFSEQLAKAASSNLLERPAEAAALPAGNLLAFGAVDMGFVRMLVMTMVVVLTGINAFVPVAAAGGDRYRFCFHLSVMLAITGITLTVVPFMVDLIFGGLVADQGAGTGLPTTVP
jgi:flagellar protein FlaJ